MAISDFIIGNEDLNSPVSIIDNLEDIRADFSLLTEKSWNPTLKARGLVTFKAEAHPKVFALFLYLRDLFLGGSLALYKTRKGKRQDSSLAVTKLPPAQKRVSLVRNKG
ncbi:hypothetical protein FAI40_03070 [Acetobacteraceae bacterium]|nr:hypothetical protein FAI40_03070 [Acetobacteraceae bacterium]